jgi:hypothetical protein
MKVLSEVDFILEQICHKRGKAMANYPSELAQDAA